MITAHRVENYGGGVRGVVGVKWGGSCPRRLGDLAREVAVRKLNGVVVVGDVGAPTQGAEMERVVGDVGRDEVGMEYDGEVWTNQRACVSRWLGQSCKIVAANTRLWCALFLSSQEG